MKKGVFLITATSKDNFISPLDKAHESSTNWTTKEDTDFFKTTTKAAGVVIFGSKTYQTIPTKYRPLSHRLNVVVTRNKDKFKNEVSDKLIATDKSPKEVIKDLRVMGFDSIAICGGHQIYQLFFDAGVVDHIYQTVEDITFKEGVPFLNQESYQKLKLSETIPLSDKTRVEVYDVIK